MQRGPVRRGLVISGSTLFGLAALVPFLLAVAVEPGEGIGAVQLVVWFLFIVLPLAFLVAMIGLILLIVGLAARSPEPPIAVLPASACTACGTPCQPGTPLCRACGRPL